MTDLSDHDQEMNLRAEIDEIDREIEKENSHM
jgi:hypothetical protein